MPGSAGSSWYFLRYVDPHNDKEFANYELLKHWLPVDLYIGGPEHAVGHLMYSRIWNRYLYDKGLSPVKEPFKKLVHQGMILGENGIKMGKRFPKYVINPSDIVKEYGADTLRLYEMFMGPLEASKPWSAKGVEGAFRFLKRSFRMVTDQPIVDRELTAEELRMLHATIKKVSEDYESLNMNTAISQLMIFVNFFAGEDKPLPREAAEKFVLLLAPVAPHVCEELWQTLGHDGTLAYGPWPEFDEKHLAVNEVEILVQVLGKPKSRITIAADADENAMREAALADEKVQTAIAGKTVRKVICVKGRLVNIVAN